MKRQAAVVAIVTGLTWAVTAARATTLWWDGGADEALGQSDNRSTAGMNWLGGGLWDDGVTSAALAAWSDGDSAIFGGSAASQAITAGSCTVGNLTFGQGAQGTGSNGTAYAVSGGTLTLSNSTITANTHTTIASVLAGTTGLTKAGGATLTLGNANSFSGEITVNQGTLRGTATTAFGPRSSARTLTVNGGGTLDFSVNGLFGAHFSASVPALVINSGGVAVNTANPGNQPLYNLTLQGGTLTSTSGNPGWGAWNINGTITATGVSELRTAAASNGGVMLASGTGASNTTVNVVNPADILTISTSVLDGRDTASPYPAHATGLTKTGSGTLVLGAASTFSGSVTVNGGTLRGTAKNAFGTGNIARTLTVNSGGTLDFRVNGLFGGHFSTSVPALVINSGGVAVNTTNPGNQPLYNLTLRGGTLTSTFGNPSWGAWNINGTITATGVSEIRTTAASNGEIMLASGTGASNTTVSVVSAGDRLTIATRILDGRDTASPYAVHATALTKTGAGVLVLAGNCAYTGVTRVEAGTLRLDVANALAGVNHVTLNGGTLDMGTAANSIGTLTVSSASGLVLGSGTLAFLDSAARVWTGSLTLSGTLGLTTLRFGVDGSALTPAQLRRITIGGSPVNITAAGYIVDARQGTVLIVR